MPAGTSYTFKEGMLSFQIKEIEIASEEKSYYKLEVKNQFLHAVHPIGWIKKLEVKIDDQMVKEEDIFFVLREQWFPASKMYTISEVFWNLSEMAEICVLKRNELSPGMHYVKCTFTMSMLEDTQVLDKKGQWPLRIEFVDGNLKLEVEGK